MAGKPLTTEVIALTEKKMDMTLDDIIKLSKNTSNKAKNQRRAPIKSQKPLNNTAKERVLKMRRYMDSRSSIRQGVLAQRRSTFQGSRFPLAAEAARRAAVAPIRVRSFDGRRAANMNKPRIGAPPPVQRRAVNRGFVAKPQRQQQMLQQRQQQQQKQQMQHVQQEHQGNATKQRPQTLDSLFANMKEQRMRVLSRQTNGVQHNGGGRQRMPWGRGGRFRN